VKGPGQLVAALCSHRFVLRVMEGMESQVLHFLVVLETKTKTKASFNNCCFALAWQVFC
jgi:hypothetical protein